MLPTFLSSRVEEWTKGNEKREQHKDTLSLV